MKKNFAFGISFVLALAALTFFNISVSAQEAVKISRNTDSLISTTLVISQAYGGGGGSTGTYLNDYVELKNISATPQSTAGLSLMYGSATGQFGSSATNIFALPTATIPPGGYYLVQLSNPGSAGAPLPVTPDASSTNLTMSGTNGKVALVTSAFTGNTCGATATPCTLPNAAIVDVVSWGTANNAEGGASTNGGAALTAVQGNVRKTNGCTETDNNNSDFEIITAPVPRNSATTPAPCGAAPTGNAPIDFNGDGKTDFAVVRNTGGGANGQVTWFTNQNGSATNTVTPWGSASDFFVPLDYDGDGKTDVAVWRAGAPFTAAYYILQSSNNTLRVDIFGQTGDDPSVTGDWDGDGKDDPAIYRGGANAGDPSLWAFRASTTGVINIRQWGQNGDFPAPGDYDGDGKHDLAIQRNAGGGQARFWFYLSATSSISSTVFGTPTDVIVPGDYDGDGKTDIAVARGSGGALNWYYLPSSGGSFVSVTWGSSATDFTAQGDYDGDGKTDIAVWRPSAVPGSSFFYSRASSNGALIANQWGQQGDYPVANYNRH